MKKAVILVGPQGSGKTTFCKETLPDYTRISQDEQGKNGHFDSFKAAINRGEDIVVDRINHLRKQRKRYIEPLKEEGYRVIIVKMNLPYDVCLDRLSNRTDHPTLTNTCNETLKSALSMYFKQYQDVRESEADGIISTTDYDPFIEDLTNSRFTKFMIIGDVHGCHDELLELLMTIQDPSNTAIVFLGDLVDKGDQIAETLDLIDNTHNIFSVMGNHENKLLRYLRGNKVSVSHGLDKTIKQIGLEDISTDRAQGLRSTLESLPAIIKLPGDVYCIHGGIDPTKHVTKQARETLMYARTFDPDTKNLRDASKYWFEYYTGTDKIFFGHQMHDEVNVAKNVYAMDGGCVHGEELRGMLYDVEKQTFDLLTVQAKKEYSPKHTENADVFDPYDKLVGEGYLRKVEDGGLVLYNYTDKCTFDGQWNKYTMECRGLTFNKSTKEVVARPFPKFFNLGEKEFTQFKNLPDLPYTVHEKMDGSLGIIYYDGNKWRVNTRGSFSSEQAIEAQEMLGDYNLTGLSRKVTLLAEIIYPSNKIIVDYGDERKLVLLGAFNRETGKEIAERIEDLNDLGASLKMSVAKTYDHTIEEMIELQKTMPKEREGFVVRFENGLRVKIKGAEYLKIARIMSRISPLTLWEAMVDGKVPDSLMAEIPEEILGDYTPLQERLELKYTDLKEKIINDYKSLVRFEPYTNRKEFAMVVSKMDHVGPMFALLDGKKDNIDKYIMKKIKPVGNVL